VNRYLPIYLDDHRAIDDGLVRTAQRVAKSNAATPWADELRSLSEAVSADAAQLDAIREAAGIDGGTLKQLAARAGERLGRFKLNGHILTYSPLSRVLETEGLMAALELKRARWQTLATLSSDHSEWGAFDFAELERRAAEQIEQLWPIHAWAVAQLD